MQSNYNNVINVDFGKDEVEISTIAQKLQRYLDLKEYVKEYEKLRRELKGLFEEVEDTVIRDFRITGKWVNKKEFVMPATTYWDMRVKKI